jgi:NADH:ubiquinone oxidoreductase subunit D
MKFWNFAQGHIEVYSVDYGAFTAFQYGLQDRNSCPNIVPQWLGQRFSNCGGGGGGGGWWGGVVKI